MLSRKNALTGLFSRNDHQPARSRPQTKVAADLEILESRELLNGAHPRLQQARIETVEVRLGQINAEHTRLLSKTEFNVMHLAQNQSNARPFTQFRGGGPTFPASQIMPTKVPLGSLGSGSPILFSLRTIAKNPGTQVNVNAPSGLATKIITPPVSSLPVQTGSSGVQPSNAPSGAPAATAPATPGQAPIVHIDVPTTGSPFGPVLF